MNHDLLNTAEKIQTRIKETTVFDPRRRTSQPFARKEFLERISDIIHAETDHLSKSFKKRIEEEFLHYGPLESILEVPEVTEIIINDWNTLWIEKNGELKPNPDSFLNRESYERIFFKICEEAKVDVSSESPFANGRWRDFRLHAATAPTAPGPTLSLRRQNLKSEKLSWFAANKTIDENQFQFMQKILKQGHNSLIVGATSSGKTALLNGWLKEINPHQRLVIIEDADELALPNSASIKLLTRSEKIGRLPAIQQADLVKQALRMRPDRIVMGEVRGGEAKDLLMALATGHQGSFSTLHADSAKQALLRLEMLIQLGAPQWPVQAVRNLIFLSLKYILVMKKNPETGQRKMQGIYEITGLEDFGFLIEPVG